MTGCRSAASAPACNDRAPIDDLGPLPRLDQLRTALLDASYHVCTQKAGLLTEYLQAHTPRPNPIAAAAERAHCRLYLRNLAAQARGQRSSRPAAWLHHLALALYDRFRPSPPEQHMVALERGFRHVLERMPLRIYDHELLVGNSSGHRVGAPIHPDYGGLLKAAELLPLFFARATAYFAGLSSASGITLGGRTADGADAVNELSHLFLCAYDRMRLRQPNLHVRVHPDSDAAFLRRCYRVLRKGGGLPALFNDDRIVDALRAEHWADRVSRLFVDTVRRHPTPRGGRYAAGFWSMTTHQGFGALTGALPSGRRAGQPLANGISPRTGRERRGPTAALSAAARVAASPNGCVLNHELQPEFLAGETGERILDGLVRGYFALGGQQVQIGVVDPAVLIDARRHPERYRDLVVRISGYSAYFNDLTDEMKDELIARTAHG